MAIDEVMECENKKIADSPQISSGLSKKSSLKNEPGDQPSPIRPPKPLPRTSLRMSQLEGEVNGPCISMRKGVGREKENEKRKEEEFPIKTENDCDIESMTNFRNESFLRRSLRRLFFRVGVGDSNLPDKKLTQTKPLKITTVGDGMVGKTCLLITYVSNEFPKEYVPTVFDNFNDKLVVDGEEHDITLWDTAGQEDYEKLRPFSYPQTDCFLVCFSVGNKTSYDNIMSKWFPELKHHCPTVPIILVATKIDLREQQEGVISSSAGRKLKRKIGASKYLECSALQNKGLKELITEAVRAGSKKRNNGNKCVVM